MFFCRKFCQNTLLCNFAIHCLPNVNSNDKNAHIRIIRKYFFEKKVNITCWSFFHKYFQLTNLVSLLKINKLLISNSKTFLINYSESKKEAILSKLTVIFCKILHSKKWKTDGNIHVRCENLFERIKCLKNFAIFYLCKKLISLKSIFPKVLLDTKKLPYLNIMEKLCESRV